MSSISKGCPPQFAKTVGDLGLEPERAGRPSWRTRSTTLTGSCAAHVRARRHPRRNPADQRGDKLWRSLWGDSSFDVQTLGVEPLEVSGGANEHESIDVLMRRDDAPIGIARVSIQPSSLSAHIVALALLHAERTQRLTRLLLTSAMRAAIKQGSTLIFAPGETEDDRALAQKLGFAEVGATVSYAARSESRDEGQGNDGFLQPVLARRR
ncbi:MAG: GNAT family N-acetyltransferase [Anaerolineae bacterium]|nr:GNAT family N-acetyltransferase [Anaerolineae bacterium]